MTRSALVLALLLPLAGCGSGQDDGGDAQAELTVLAASSLTDVYQELATSFEEENDADVTFSFGSSTDLAEQAADGAPGDVLATADETSMKVAEDAGVAGDVTDFATNVMVIVTPAGNPAGIKSLDDLGDTPLIGHTDCRGLARVEAQLRARGLDPEFAFRSDVNATIQALVGAGVGAAVLPVLAIDASDKLTTTCDLPMIPPRILAIVRHRDRYHSAAAKAFVDAARAVCSTLTTPTRLAAV